jgi:hypothetical protein
MFEGKAEEAMTLDISLFGGRSRDEAELDTAFTRLSGGGAVRMPGDYGFSRKFTWVSPFDEEVVP